MSAAFFKRFQMEISLRGRSLQSLDIPEGYRLVPWSESLLAAHARTKAACFKNELDSNIFPCLGEYEGCYKLMKDISERRGFLPEATWLLEYFGGGEEKRAFCGTVQGIAIDKQCGGIQNVGITPDHRGQGLSFVLLDAALAGFQQVGLKKAALEVTAQNKTAVRIYKRYGFRQTKVLYKSVEVVWS